MVITPEWLGAIAQAIIAACAIWGVQGYQSDRKANRLTPNDATVSIELGTNEIAEVLKRRNHG